MEATFIEETDPAPQDLTLLLQMTRDMIARWQTGGKKTKRGGRPLTFLFPAKH